MPDRPANLITVLLWMSVVSLTPNAVAQAVPDPTSPCTLDSGPARDFDFWVGEWEVVPPGGDELAGRNRISVREGGCLLVEDWQGASGSTGMSMTFHDPHRDAWRQVWQSESALIELEGGLDGAGRMAMEGTIAYHANGQRIPFRGRWTRTTTAPCCRSSGSRARTARGRCGSSGSTVGSTEALVRRTGDK